MASPPSSTPASASRNETAEKEVQLLSAMLTPAPTSPFNVFAFSVPPPSQGRRGSEQSYAKYSTAASTGTGLATPYSQPLQTPADDQPLPLPYPGPRRRSSVRETETQPATTALRTTTTPPSFTYPPTTGQLERPSDEQDQSASELPPISSAGNSSSGPTSGDARLAESHKEVELGSSNKDSEVRRAPNDRSHPQLQDDTDADQGEDDSPFEEVRAIKEHALIFIMSNCPISAPYGLNFVLVARKYYNVELGPGFFFCLHLSTAALSYSFGWITQRIFVKPSKMIWPTALLTSSLLNTLHAGNTGGKLRLTRVKYFSHITGISALYYFIPGFLFTGLSYFSFICWIFPKNVVANQLFGTAAGLGMSVLTFDWAQISFMGSPFLTPWWAAIQSFVGFVLFYWIILPILYYTNSFKTGHLPIMGYLAYDRFGLPYNIDQILNQDRTFNATAYAEYSPLYIPVSLLVTYLTAFVLATAFVVATILDFGDDLWKALRGQQQEVGDVHAR
ncbi:hypothetical protein FS837_012799 [Tulasnella sp. UAMH 9824]|nr:hypothetical protein FS837_012799 [Tulasnella sp. UAMH 9824]